MIHPPTSRRRHLARRQAQTKSSQDINEKRSTRAGTKRKITMLKRTTRPVLQRDVNLVATHRVISSTRKTRNENQKNIVWPRTELVQPVRKKATQVLVVPKNPKLTPNLLKFASSTWTKTTANPLLLAIWSSGRKKAERLRRRSSPIQDAPKPSSRKS